MQAKCKGVFQFKTSYMYSEWKVVTFNLQAVSPFSSDCAFAPHTSSLSYRLLQLTETMSGSSYWAFLGARKCWTCSFIKGKAADRCFHTWYVWRIRSKTEDVFLLLGSVSLDICKHSHHSDAEQNKQDKVVSSHFQLISGLLHLQSKYNQHNNRNKQPPD